MKIQIVGSGGREHALAWALARHGHQVLCAPGNPGMARVGECAPVKVDDLEGQVRLARERGIQLVVVGPEAPLCAGLADAVRAAGVPCFGPSKDAARLEGSKTWAKRFFRRHSIPTAEFSVCKSMVEVDAALRWLGDRVVVKADGLAAGKGVVVARDAAEARAAAGEMLLKGAFGEAGRQVVVERRLSGRECSILALTDGARFAVLPGVEDHKAVFDGDRGPNTGGMGTVSPAAGLTADQVARVEREVLAPTVAGLREERLDYRGVLFAGLMIGEDGTPWVLEYNCRFGDPETEPLMARWEGDPAPWLAGAAAGALPAGAPPFTRRAAVCVVMAAAGYPGSPRTGDPIRGVADAEAMPDVVVFHAGTKQDGDRLITGGGRVLAVTALGEDVAAARARAYQAVGAIAWDGAHYRKDIGDRRR